MNNDSRDLKILEAILFTSSEPVKREIISSKLPDTIKIDMIMNEICNIYKDRGIECLRINASWAFRTPKDVSDYLDGERVVTKPLSRPAISPSESISYTTADCSLLGLVKSQLGLSINSSICCFCSWCL